MTNNRKEKLSLYRQATRAAKARWERWEAMQPKKIKLTIWQQLTSK